MHVRNPSVQMMHKRHFEIQALAYIFIRIHFFVHCAMLRRRMLPRHLESKALGAPLHSNDEATQRHTLIHARACRRRVAGRARSRCSVTGANLAFTKLKP